MGILTRSGFIALTFLFLVNQTASSAPLAVPGAALPADTSKIGIIAAIKGEVKISGTAQAGRIAQNGEPVFTGDTVSTNSAGVLQILLLDETIFTIGPDSSIVIDQFVYNPATHDGQVNATVVKGVFRFVTGKIARKKPSDMKVNLPSGTIGVRGTIALGRTDGSRSTVVLLGPGSKHNTNHRTGQITVGNQVGGETKEVTVSRPGYGSTIDGPGSEPSEPFEVPAEQLAEMTGALEPSQSDSGSDDDKDSNGSGDDGDDSDAEEDSGQDTAAAGDSVESESALNELLSETSKEAAQASQDDFEDDAGGLDDGVTTVEDLDLITEGKFHYSDKNVPLAGGVGGSTYDFDIDIDFGSRTIGNNGLTVSNRMEVTIQTGGPVHNATYALGEKSFDLLTGDLAVFEYNGVPNTNSPGCPACTNADIVVSLVNGEGSIANNAAHSIEFSDNTTPYEGAGLTDARVESP